VLTILCSTNRRLDSWPQPNLIVFCFIVVLKISKTSEIKIIFNDKEIKFRIIREVIEVNRLILLNIKFSFLDNFEIIFCSEKWLLKNNIFNLK
jgi:hypothetical protein